MRVFDLIDGRSMQWKESTLSSILQPEDAALVRSIPLPVQDMEDRLIWHYSATGEYTVRSGYESAMMMKRNGVGNSRGRGESSSRDAEKKIWTKD
ncbi:hypothetical protein Vadar_028625 [Vaccinium darrowii]|uniref:Uncharacterized protein n=1 Tax=Vaccinium darrowii TaxID=229202 RepID=A0ACB7YQX5_9ERIC|nr:hypothetical protein Vadar_028625 [Vaccinium darrowii]